MYMAHTHAQVPAGPYCLPCTGPHALQGLPDASTTRDDVLLPSGGRHASVGRRRSESEGDLGLGGAGLGAGGAGGSGGNIGLAAGWFSWFLRDKPDGVGVGGGLGGSVSGGRQEDGVAAAAAAAAAGAVGSVAALPAMLQRQVGMGWWEGRAVLGWGGVGWALPCWPCCSGRWGNSQKGFFPGSVTVGCVGMGCGTPLAMLQRQVGKRVGVAFVGVG